MTCATCGIQGCQEHNPRGVNQPNAPGATVHPNAAPACSLVEGLGAVVDDIRQIATDLGVRPYRMFSVAVKWSGGEVGRGTCTVISEMEFLPTPKVTDTAGVTGVLRSGGLAERGSVRVTQISPRYTEDQVDAFFHTRHKPKDEEGWVEIRIDARDGSTERRRFVVAGVPYRDAERFQWTVNLLRQDQDRLRSGVPYPYAR